MKLLAPHAKPAHLPLYHPAVLVATWFGAGLVRYAPGTMGSLVALPVGWLIHWAAGPAVLLAAAVAVFLAGWWATVRFIEGSEIPDPGAVVVDEVAGQWIVLAAAPPGALYVALAFVLFRIFDIAKPWPVSWADRNLKGGFGVMADDVIAGVQGGIVMLLAAWLVEDGHVF